jgi:lysine/ornithine N-monooxygenase
LPDRDFIPPYNRPSLALFQKHCAHVIHTNRLDALHINGRVEALLNQQSYVQAETTAGRFNARNVLLAIGMGEQPSWPDWADSLKRQGADIQHVFSPDFDRCSLHDTPSTVVVGGGITAVQLALKLTREHTGKIIVLSGHPLREQFYDFNPCWIGPKCLTDYYKLDYHRRRRIIDQERVPGTLPAEVFESFTVALKSGNPSFRNERVNDARCMEDGIELITENGSLRAERVLLATGFQNKRPGSPLVEQVISEFDLACNECGYPIVGKDLRWGERIYVTGPLAELQVGPCARNIIGARNAGRLLGAALHK